MQHVRILSPSPMEQEALKVQLGPMLLEWNAWTHWLVKAEKSLALFSSSDLAEILPGLTKRVSPAILGTGQWQVQMTDIA